MIPKQQHGVEEHGCGGARSRSSQNGTNSVCAENVSLCENGQNVSRNVGRHGHNKKSKSEYLNRKSLPVASPEADDEDEDYHCGRNSVRDHRILEKYCHQNSKPTVGTTPSRKQWDYREGVS
jgi:hypothetical protein